MAEDAANQYQEVLIQPRHATSRGLSGVSGGSDLPARADRGDRFNTAGIEFDYLDANQIPEIIDDWRRSGRREYISITNPHSVMMCYRDADMRKATTEAALTLPDGIGIVLAAAVLGYGRRHRITGPRLMLKLCDLGRDFGFRHYFFGGAEGVAERLETRLVDRFPGLTVAGTCCPPFRALSAEEDRNWSTGSTTRSRTSSGSASGRRNRRNGWPSMQAASAPPR